MVTCHLTSAKDTGKRNGSEDLALKTILENDQKNILEAKIVTFVYRFFMKLSS